MSALVQSVSMRGLPAFPDGSEGQQIEARARQWRAEFQSSPAVRRIQLAMIITGGLHVAADLRAKRAAEFTEAYR